MGRIQGVRAMNRRAREFDRQWKEYCSETAIPFKMLPDGMFVTGFFSLGRKDISNFTYIL